MLPRPGRDQLLEGGRGRQTRVVGHDRNLVRGPANLAQEAQIPMQILSRLPRHWRRIGRDRQRAVAYGCFHVSKQLKILGCSARKGFDVQMDAIRTGLDKTARMFGERLALALSFRFTSLSKIPPVHGNDADFGCDPVDLGEKPAARSGS